MITKKIKKEKRKEMIMLYRDNRGIKIQKTENGLILMSQYEKHPEFPYYTSSCRSVGRVGNMFVIDNYHALNYDVDEAYAYFKLTGAKDFDIKKYVEVVKANERKELIKLCETIWDAWEKVGYAERRHPRGPYNEDYAIFSSGKLTLDPYVWGPKQIIVNSKEEFIDICLKNGERFLDVLPIKTTKSIIFGHNYGK